MRQWPRRFAETVFEDRTRQIQVLCVLAAFLVGYWLLAFNTPTNAKTAQAIFFFFDERTFAVILFVAGGLQLLAVGWPWWWLRFFAASVKWTIWVYATSCYWLTNREAVAVPLLCVICVAEFWIGMRSLHDKDLNGTDRRTHV